MVVEGLESDQFRQIADVLWQGSPQLVAPNFYFAAG